MVSLPAQFSQAHHPHSEWHLQGDRGAWEGQRGRGVPPGEGGS